MCIDDARECAGRRRVGGHDHVRTDDSLRTRPGRPRGLQTTFDDWKSIATVCRRSGGTGVAFRVERRELARHRELVAGIVRANRQQIR